MPHKTDCSKEVMVPSVPTPEMLDLGCDAAHGWPTNRDVEAQWAAMLQVATQESVRPWPTEETVRVPIEPSSSMLAAGLANACGPHPTADDVRRQWLAMVGPFRSP